MPIPAILSNLKAKVNGTLAVFLLNDKGNVLYSDEISETNDDQTLKTIAQACSNNIAVFEDTIAEEGENLNIIEMELSAKEKAIYLQKIEIGSEKFILLCVIGTQKLHSGVARAKIDTKVKADIIRELQA